MSVGLIDQLVTQSSRFGGQTRTHHGVDVVLGGRFGDGGTFGGGTSTGRTANECVVSMRRCSSATT